MFFIEKINEKSFQDKYFWIISKIANFDKKMNPTFVDFDSPIYKPLLNHKFIFSLDVFSEIFQAAFSSLTPLILGHIIYTQNTNILFIFGVTYILMELFNRVILRFRAIYLLSIENGINYSAYRYFLTVDPIFHTTKSSGQIISKIERGAQAYGDFIGIFLGNSVSIVISFVTIIATLSAFNLSLGLISAVTFIFLAITNSFFTFLNSKILVKRVIKAKDKKTALNVENLQQNALIRSSFATNEQDKKTIKLTQSLMLARGISWMGGGLSVSLSRILFLVATIFLSMQILELVKTSQMDTVTGVALLVTFLSASRSVYMIGSIIRDTTEKYAEIQDLFKFIRGFGKQTFPVLESEDMHLPVRSSSQEPGGRRLHTQRKQNSL